MHLAEIDATVLDGRTKGIPVATAPFALRDIAQKGWNVMAGDLPLPLMLLRRSHLDHNAAEFGRYLAAQSLSLAPHGKTTMAPQIFAEQLRDGAWAITAATAGQLHVMHRFGVRRIILGNQALGRANIAAIAAALDDGVEVHAFTDSPAHLAHLVEHLGDLAPKTPLGLLLEVGVAQGRTGVRNLDQAQALARAIAAADPALVRFTGVAGFEGVVPGADTDPGLITAYADTLVDIAAGLPPDLYRGLDEFILSGGGSAFFDLMADRFAGLSLPLPVRIVLRSGCYVTGDSGSYASAQEAARADPRRSWTGRLKPALEVWSWVQSLPEPGLAILSMGKRDVPHDAGLPTPFARHRPGTGPLPLGEARVFAANDQHAFARVPADCDWQVGDMIGAGISHPCTAFDKWRFLPVVNDDYDVTAGMLTFF